MAWGAAGAMHSINPNGRNIIFWERTRDAPLRDLPDTEQDLIEALDAVTRERAVLAWRARTLRSALTAAQRARRTREGRP
jgi:hypothetical protein